MSRNRPLLRILTLVGLIGVVLVSTQRLPAGFTAATSRTFVEIDGVNYGPFDQITGLDQFSPSEKTADFNRVSLRRDFVTDPSLYLWAKNLMTKRSGLKDIHLVTANSNGEETSRYVLKLCQPLAWTVEAANPAIGGFHETIDIAVQDVAVY